MDDSEGYDYDEFDEADDEDEFDCHWMPGTGQCMAAGSEDCDWSCPFRDDYERESRALAAKEDAQSKRAG